MARGVGSTEPRKSEGAGLAGAGSGSSGVGSTEPRKSEGARELITDSKTGLLIPIEDEDVLTSNILRLLTHADERIRLGQAAQQYAAANFSLERMVDETLRIYEALGSQG